ncbi:hypothetical protein MHBO_003395 [Bonamia ostreae]|uniref:Uncharacterized protein n=1 Tax=Bonamia ostreae TaxID=126728 RepID=A0ABV2AQB8_9EUKA
MSLHKQKAPLNSTIPLPPKNYHKIIDIKQNRKPDNKQYLSFARNPFSPKSFENPIEPAIKYAHGTTTLAFKIKDAVIVAVDSRSSMGSSYISSNNVKKIVPVAKNILCTIAGGAADCMYWARYVGVQVFSLIR